jgi:hypothetical protein
MSALGQKQTSLFAQVMSALPPKADIERHDRHVRFVPKADIRIAAKLSYSITSSARASSTEGVDDQLELARLHHRRSAMSPKPRAGTPRLSPHRLAFGDRSRELR